MNQFLKNVVEETAYLSIQENNPKLLKIIETFIRKGLTAEQILNICVRKTGQPRHRLAFIGCAADYLINNPALITETIQ